MNINTDKIVSISDANRNFSQTARLVDKLGEVYIFKNNKPKYNTSALDTVTITNNQHAAKTFDLKGFVKKVAAGTVTNYGIVLINTSSTVKYAGFYGSRTASSSYRPKLVVTYYSKPTKASSAGLSSNYNTDSTDITLHYSGIKSTGLDHCEYKIVAYNDQTKAEGNVVKAYSASRPASIGQGMQGREGARGSCISNRTRRRSCAFSFRKRRKAVRDRPLPICSMRQTMLTLRKPVTAWMMGRIRRSETSRLQARGSRQRFLTDPALIRSRCP